MNPKRLATREVSSVTLTSVKFAKRVACIKKSSSRVQFRG